MHDTLVSFFYEFLFYSLLSVVFIEVRNSTFWKIMLFVTVDRNFPARRMAPYIIYGVVMHGK